MDNNYDEHIIFDFFKFDVRDIAEISYLIQLSKKLNIETECFNSIFNYPSFDDEYPAKSYKMTFMLELTWRLVELVCARFYPQIALSQLEDFGLFFQNIYLDNKTTNQFYLWLAKNDLRMMDKEKIIAKHYMDLKETYDSYDANLNYY